MSPAAPLFQQQQSVLTTLVDAWDGMTADARKQMLAAIFDNITADGGGVTGWNRARTGDPTSSRPSPSR